MDCNSLSVKLGLFLGGSLGTKLGKILSADLGKFVGLSFRTTLSRFMRNSLGCTLGESDCESLGTKMLVLNLIQHLVLMVKCFGIHLVSYFVIPKTKHLVHGVELIIWIGHHLVLNSAYCLEAHLVHYA